MLHDDALADTTPARAVTAAPVANDGDATARSEPPMPANGDAVPDDDATATALATTVPIALPAALRAAVAQAAGYAASAQAPATRRAYAGDWQDWTAWCATAGLEPLPAPPAAVGAFLAERAERLSVATLGRRLSAISVAHRDAGHHLDTKHPAIRQVLRGIRREKGTAPRRARAVTTALLRTLLASCDDSLIGVRDKALLLVGFASAMRRSELVALTRADVAFSSDGVTLRIRRSKTDQEAVGDVIGVLATGTPTCPVAALQAWLTMAGITSGKVFRSITRHGHMHESMTGEAVALIVQKRAALAGLDPRAFSAHSLRAGLATSAAAAGLEERNIQRQTRHRSVAVLRGYIREGNVFRHNVSGAVGL